MGPGVALAAGHSQWVAVPPAVGISVGAGVPMKVAIAVGVAAIGLCRGVGTGVVTAAGRREPGAEYPNRSLTVRTGLAGTVEMGVAVLVG